jgi:hypothetical protein
MLQFAVELRHDVHERRAEEDEARADLVEHRRRSRPEVVRSPQLLDRRPELEPCELEVAGQERALVEVAHEGEDAGELLHRRPAPRLGGMSGEHEANLRATEERLERTSARAPVREDPEPLLERSSPHGGARLRLAHPQTPDALVVLGQVHELQVSREGARQHLGLLGRGRGHERRELLGGALPAGVKGLRESPDPLLEVERGPALVGDDHLAEQVPEQAHVVG